MKRALSIAMFVHSLRSDWNNGNAHFLRGLARELGNMGHDVRCFEPRHGWSVEQLLAVENEAGEEALRDFRKSFPSLAVHTYTTSSICPALLRDTDVVIVHEWNEPETVAAILDAAGSSGTRTLFHDTHHRASSTPQQLRQLQIERFDGVLAFGESLRTIYRQRWGMNRVWTLHEAADAAAFHPIAAQKKQDVIWVGNWGDEERTAELHRFLVEPAQALPDLCFTVHGVRYPQAGLDALASAGIAFAGYLPNLAAPCVYAQSRVTVHVPRRAYAEALPGIPTIRVFEALACGIPLVSAPWSDCEHLFRKGDFTMVRSTAGMTDALRALTADSALARQQAEQGRQTILQRHTCAHRAAQLTEICEEVLQ